MDTLSDLTESETQERLIISTLNSLKSSTTAQQQPGISNTPTGGLPPQHVMNSIDELRNFSSALSAFLSHYDELQNHINFINSSIDSKLPKHLVDTTNPKLTCLLEIVRDQTVTALPEVVVSEQSPEVSERIHAIARTSISPIFSHSSEEIGNSKKSKEIDVFKRNVEIDTLKRHEEFDVSKNIDVLKEHAENDTSKKPEETSCDQIITGVLESIISEHSPNGLDTDDEQIYEEDVRTPESLEEVDTLMQTEETVPETFGDQVITDVPEAIVLEQNPNRMTKNCEQIHENVRTPESLEEIDVSKKPEVIDASKKHEETVSEMSCGKTLIAVPEAIVSEQNPKGLVTNCEQSDEDVWTPESLEEDDTLMQTEETVPETSCDKTITVVPEVLEQNSKGLATNREQSHEDVRTPESHEEVDTLMKTEETDSETSCDKTVTAVPEAIVSEQNHNGLAANCEQIHEDVRTPKSLEEIDTLMQTEETVPETSCDKTVTAGPKAIISEQNPNGLATNHEHSHEDVRTPEILEEIYVSKKSEEIDIVKKPEQTDFCKNPEEIDTSKKNEETAKEISGSVTPEENSKTSKKYRISEFEFFCREMNPKGMRKHVFAHYSELSKLRKEVAKALKLAKDPANLVLSYIGRFFVDSSLVYRNGQAQNNRRLARMAAVLILECFVMISSDGIKIAKKDQEYAAGAAFDWRKRMIYEGGLRHTDEADARGLLLFISGFGIQDHVFKIQDIMDLILASNVRGIATALCGSVFLIPKIPEVIHLMVMSNLEIEAVDIAYTFGLEDLCHPRSILTTYLHKKVKDIPNGSFQMLEARKQQLFDLRSVKHCLESHNVDPLVLLPDFNINEKIQNLEKEIQKRKSLEYPIHHEPKRACFSPENMPHQQNPFDHHGMSQYNRSTQPSTSHVNSQPYGWDKPYVQHHPRHGQTYDSPPYGQHYSRHGQTYDSPPHGRPSGWGPPGFVHASPSGGFPGRQGPSSDLYSFVDLVEM